MKLEFYPGALDKVGKQLDKAIELTAEWLMGNIRKHQTIPRDTGTLQDEAMHVVINAAGSVDIVQSGPYARRLYYHPEYNFSMAKNPNAGALWWEPYLQGGNMYPVVQKTFYRMCREVGLEVTK